MNVTRREFLKGFGAGAVTIAAAGTGLVSLVGSSSQNNSPLGDGWFQPRYGSHGAPDYGFHGNVLLSAKKFGEDGESFCEVNIVKHYSSANGGLELHVREHLVPISYFSEIMPPQEFLGSSGDGHKINDYIIEVADGEPKLVKVRQTFRDGATIQHSDNIPALVVVNGDTKFSSHEDLRSLIQKYNLSGAVSYTQRLRTQNSNH